MVLYNYCYKLLLILFIQAKEYLSAVSLRRILALQNELIRATHQLPPERSNISAPTAGLQAAPGSRNAGQRALLSANFGVPVQNGNARGGAGTLGRGILSAGDKLRDLIIPESLASVVSGGMWSTGLDRMGMGMGMLWGGGERQEKDDKTRRVEKAREELDELLAGACPLCESVVTGLDRPFVKEGEEDDSWQI